MKADLTLPALELLPDGSNRSVLVSPKIGGKVRQRLIEAARAGEELEEDKARHVRVVEYEVPDRDGDGKGEVIALVTTITQMTAAPAPLLPGADHQRWEYETGNKRARHNSYRVKRPGDHGTATPAPPRSAWSATSHSCSQHDQLKAEWHRARSC